MIFTFSIKNLKLYSGVKQRKKFQINTKHIILGFRVEIVKSLYLNIKSVIIFFFFTV